MKTRWMAWTMIYGTLVLTSCTAVPTSQNLAWDVSPLMKISHGADQADDWYQQGRRAQEAGQFDLALASYHEALQRNAEHVDALNGRGVIHAIQGRYEESMADFGMAIKKAPRRAYLFNNLGYACLLAGHHGEAQLALEQALALEPGHLRAERNLANLQLAEATPATTESAALSAATPDQPSSSATDTTPVASQISLVAISPQVYELRSTTSASQSEVPRVASPSPAPPSATLMTARLEVSNGNGAPGMAHAAARFLDGQGFTTARLTNQKPFDQPVTEIRYRSGYRDAAESVRTAFPTQAVVQESKTLRADIQVRLVLGKDMKNDLALLTPSTTTLAMAK